MDDHIKNKKAIALSYDRDKDIAPILVAKGKGKIAQQMVEIAKQNGIEVKEDRDLAMLLSQLELDSIIPVEIYAAVAEILTYIYQKDQQKRS